jgi:hypothetical protein
MAPKTDGGKVPFCKEVNMTYREVVRLIGWCLIIPQNVSYTITLALVVTASVAIAALFGDTMKGFYATSSLMGVMPLAFIMSPKVARLFNR